jgi:hypothetical protein
MADRNLALAAPAPTIEIARPLNLPSQFALALWHARSRREGMLTPAQEAALGAVAAVWRRIHPDRLRIDRYRDVCGHRADDPVPATWIETLFLGPMAAIVLSDAFPFSPLGLIHLRQHITSARPVGPDEELDAVCRLAAVRETGRGFEIDFAMTLHSDGEVPWSGLATVLSRNAVTRERTRRDEARSAEREDEGWNVQLIDAPADIGRRYASASGDWNPHHLWPATARLVGYRRPIAHGMWTLGRALAHLETLPATGVFTPWTAEADFKRPIYLPGRATLRWRDGGGGDLRFEVRHAETGEPHLVGRFRSG